MPGLLDILKLILGNQGGIQSPGLGGVGTPGINPNAQLPGIGGQPTGIPSVGDVLGSPSVSTTPGSLPPGGTPPTFPGTPPIVPPTGQQQQPQGLLAALAPLLQMGTTLGLTQGNPIARGAAFRTQREREEQERQAAIERERLGLEGRRVGALEQQVGFEGRRVTEGEAAGRETRTQNSRTNARTRAEDAALGEGSYADLSEETRQFITETQFNGFKKKAESASELQKLNIKLRSLEIDTEGLGIDAKTTTAAIKQASRLITASLAKGEEFDISTVPDDLRKLLSDDEILGIVEEVRQQREAGGLKNAESRALAEQRLAAAALSRAQAKAEGQPGDVKPTGKNIQDLAKLGNTIEEFKRISEAFDPSFVGMGQGVKSFLQNTVPGLQIFGEKEEEFRASILNTLAAKINEMAGAALSPEEAQRYIAGLPELKDKPRKFQAELKEVIRQMEASLTSGSTAFKLDANRFVKSPIGGQPIAAEVGTFTDVDAEALKEFGLAP